MSNIESHSFKITVGTALSVIGYIIYTSINYGTWTQKIESRLDKLDITAQSYELDTKKNQDNIRELDKRISGQDVTLAEIKKDVSQILFEIRKR